MQTCVIDSFFIFADYSTYVELWNLQVFRHDHSFTISPSYNHIFLRLGILCKEKEKGLSNVLRVWIE